MKMSCTGSIDWSTVEYTAPSIQLLLANFYRFHSAKCTFLKNDQ